MLEKVMPAHFFSVGYVQPYIVGFPFGLYVFC
jgi:hypothetical protein